MCINNDTIVNGRKENSNFIWPGQEGFLSWPLKNKDEFSREEAQVRALWAEHERTWCELSSASHSSGLGAAGSAH